MSENVEKVLRARLKEARLEGGWTQIDLARALGEPQSFVSKYEIGERRLTFVEVLRLCRVLQLDVGELARILQQEDGSEA